MDTISIPGFEILGKIGEGAMGTVWRAHQTSLDRVVAIKTLRPAFAAGEAELKQLIHEARSAARLKHENLVQVYDVAEMDGIYYIVVEYVAGSTVNEMLKQEGAFPQKRALAIVEAVAEALDYAWNKSRTIHRDMKPDNIMIDEDGVVKVADLGLARMADPVNLAAQIRTGEILTKPNYMSPEQAKCTIRVDYQTDMYSLGACLYHMTTGIVPFYECEPVDVLDRHIEGRLPNPRAVNPNISIGLTNFIVTMMMKDPKYRYADWGDALADIEKLISGRVVVMKRDPSAVSTVEAAVTKPKTAVEPAAVEPEPVPAAVPLWFRSSAWCVLLLWLTFLAYSVLRAAGPFVPKPRAPQSARPTGVAARPSPRHPPPAMSSSRRQVDPAAQAPAPTRFVTRPPAEKTTRTPPPSPPAVTQEPAAVPPPVPVVEPPPTVVSSDQPVATAQQQADGPADQAQAAATDKTDLPAPTEVAEEEIDVDAQLQNFKMTVANHVMAEDFDMATAVIDNELEYDHTPEFEEEMRGVKRFIDDVALMNTIIADGFSRKIGKQVMITQRKQKRTINIKSVADGRINAALVSAIGNKTRTTPISFSVSQLDAGERARWLGPASRPAKCAMKFILLMKSGNHRSARTFAPKSGPLSDVFVRQVESKLGGGRPE